MKVVKGPDDFHEERLNEMIQQYEKDLLRVCCVYLKDMALAEDAVQETFLRAYKALGAFRGDSEEKTWLVRIAINVCKGIRRNAWYRFVDRRVNCEQLEIAQCEQDEISRSLMAEIMRLPRKYMEVILLYYYEDLKLTEIAPMLGISQAMVCKRLKKAREMLKGMLEGVSIDEE